MFWRHPKETPLTLFFASDIHGSEKCFLKFVNAAKFYNAQVLILGGDVTGKGLVPLVHTGSGTYTVDFLGAQHTARTDADVQGVEKQVRFNGFYPYRCEPDELAQMQADEKYAHQVFTRVMKVSVERWVAIADERLESLGIPCYVMPGNDDETFVSDALAGGKWVKQSDGKVLDVGKFQLLSSGYANPTPWNTCRELPETELDSLLQGLATRLDRSRPAIFNLHCPPHASNLDMAPQLNADMSMVTEGGQPKFVPVGSTAVRRLIEQFQPVLSLHGHVHESRGVARIGQTVCINPGSDYSGGVLRGAIVKLTARGVMSHQLVAG